MKYLITIILLVNVFFCLAQNEDEGSSYFYSPHNAIFNLSNNVTTDTAFTGALTFNRGYHLNSTRIGELGYTNVADNHLYFSNFSEDGYLAFQVEGNTKMALDNDGWLQMSTGIWAGPNWYLNDTGQAGTGLYFNNGSLLLDSYPMQLEELDFGSAANGSVDEAFIEIRDDFAPGGKTGIAIWDINAANGYASIKLGDDGTGSNFDVGNYWEVAFNNNQLHFIQDGAVQFIIPSGGIPSFNNPAGGSASALTSRTIFSVPSGNGVSSQLWIKD